MHNWTASLHTLLVGSSSLRSLPAGALEVQCFPLNHLDIPSFTLLLAWISQRHSYLRLVLAAGRLPHLSWLYLADFKEQIQVEVGTMICYQMSEEPLGVVVIKWQGGFAENTDDFRWGISWPVGVLRQNREVRFK